MTCMYGWLEDVRLLEHLNTVQGRFHMVTCLLVGSFFIGQAFTTAEI